MSLARILTSGRLPPQQLPGTAWSTVDVPEFSGNFTSIASSEDGVVLIAGAIGGYVHTSYDSGVTWAPNTSTGIGGYGWEVAISKDGTTMIAAKINGPIYVSVNIGVFIILTGGTYNTSSAIWTGLSIIRDVANIYIAACYYTTGTDRGFVTGASSNSGISWVVNSTITSNTLTDVEIVNPTTIVATATGFVYILSGSFNPNNWTFTNIDNVGGLQWVKIAPTNNTTGVVAYVINSSISQIYTVNYTGLAWSLGVLYGSYSLQWKTIACNSTGSTILATYYDVGWSAVVSENINGTWRHIYETDVHSYDTTHTMAVACDGTGSKLITAAYDYGIKTLYRQLNTSLIWTESTLPPSNGWSLVAYTNNRFLAFRSYISDTASTSLDGITWETISLPLNAFWRAVSYGNGVFVAMTAQTTVAATSTDGIVWTQRVLPAIAEWNGITYGNGKFVIIGANTDKVMTSSDGISWVVHTLPVIAFLTAIAYGNGKFVAIGYNSISVNSTDGVNWTTSNIPDGHWRSITYGNGIFVTMAGYSPDSLSLVCTDGINWELGVLPPNGGVWARTTYGNGVFVAISYYPAALATSTDGKHWVQGTLPPLSVTANDPNYISYGNGRFVVVWNNTSSASVAIAAKDLTWFTRTIPYGIWNAITYASRPGQGIDGAFVAVGGIPDANDTTTSTWAATTDGISWTTGRDLSPDYNWVAITVGADRFVAISDKSRVNGNGSNTIAYKTQLSNNNWVIRTQSLPAEAKWKGIAYGDGKYVAIGSSVIAYCPQGNIETSGFTSPIITRTYDWSSIAYGNFRFVIVAETPSQAAYTMDGINWVNVDTRFNVGLKAITYGNGLFVAIASDYTSILYTEDGMSWNRVQNALIANREYSSITFGDGKFIIVTKSINNSDTNVYLTSEDGKIWTQHTLPQYKKWNSVAYGSGVYIAVGSGSIASTSDTQWLQHGYTGKSPWWECASTNSNYNGSGAPDGSVIVAAGYTNSKLYISRDYGVSWGIYNWSGGTGQERWSSVAVSPNGGIAIATIYGGGIIKAVWDGTVWTISKTTAPTNLWVSVDISGDVILACSETGVYKSVDAGLTFTLIVSVNDLISAGKINDIYLVHNQTNLLAVATSSGLYLYNSTGVWINVASTDNIVSINGSYDGSKLVAVKVASAETSLWVRAQSIFFDNTLFANIPIPAYVYPLGTASTTPIVAKLTGDGNNIIAAFYDSTVYKRPGTSLLVNDWVPIPVNNVSQSLKTADLAVSYTGNTSYIVTEYGYLYKTSTFGNSWFAINTQENAGVWDAVASDQTGQNLLAAKNGGYIYKSADYGYAGTWQIQQPTGKKNWTSVSSSNDGTKLIAVNYTGASTGEIWTYVGGVWNIESTAITLYRWLSSAISTNGESMYAAGYTGTAISVIKSIDTGATWSAITLPNQPSQLSGADCKVSCNSTGSIVALLAPTTALATAHLYINNNGGSGSWSIISLTGITISSTDTYALSVLPSGAGVALAVSGHGVYYITPNGGGNWPSSINSSNNITPTGQLNNWSSISSASISGIEYLTVINKNGYVFVSSSAFTTSSWTQRQNLGSRPWSAISNSGDNTDLLAVATSNPNQIFVSKG